MSEKCEVMEGALRGLNDLNRKERMQPIKSIITREPIVGLNILVNEFCKESNMATRFLFSLRVTH